MWILVLIAFVVVAYLRHSKDFPKLNGLYSQQIDAWYYIKLVPLTIFLAIHRIIDSVRRRRHPDLELKLHNLSNKPKRNEVNALTFVVGDKNGNVVSVRLRRHWGQLADIGLQVRLADGRVLSHAIQPDSLTTDETPTGEEADEGYISAGGLRIRAIDPVRTYRLLYSGVMRTDDAATDEKGQFVHVDLRLWFRALADPVDFTVDYSPTIAAECIAIEPNSLSSLVNFVHPHNASHVQQSGEMRGVVEVSGTRNELLLHGMRDYALGDAKLSSSSGFFVLRVRFEGGLIFSLHIDSQKDGGLTHNVSGFVFFQNGFVYPVSWTDLHLSFLPACGNIPRKLSFHVGAHGRIYEMHVEVLSTSTAHLSSNQSHLESLVVHENIVKVVMNGDAVDGENVGYGTIEFNNCGQTVKSNRSLAERQVLLANQPAPVLPITVPQCVQLHDPVCRISSVTGGKAAKLADIVSVVCKMDASIVDLKVPDGFAITVAAYENHLKSAPHLSGHIDKVLKISSQMNQSTDANKLASLTAELETACQQLHDAFLETPLTQSLQDEIIKHMEKTFGADKWKTAFTAVRSSAVGEDGTEASGAGQMETFLGRRGLQKICEAVKLCWASHYAFRAVQYRRQLCASLESPMAVLVQELVKAEVAGVLFTRHPDSGSTARSVINACYGIGEGVVSGHVQPDTISVYKEDPASDNVRIAYDVLGEKATAYKLDEEKGIVEEGELDTLQLEQNAGCCLNEDEIRRLCRAGKLIERIFGSGRDVEFAFKKEAASGAPSIFILQARPITTADMEHEWELMHELDTPLASDREWLTTANVQEMMPGALAPLSCRTWIDGIGEPLERAQLRNFMKPKQRFKRPRQIACYYQHLFLNWTMVGPAMTKEFNKRAGDMALFGKPTDLKTQTFIEQNDMSSDIWKQVLNVLDWKDRLLPRRGMEAYEDLIHNYKSPSASNAADQYRQITGMMNLLQEVWHEHIFITAASSFYPIVIMSTLDETMNWGPQIYEDMATMLSSCTDVFSADVPTLLQTIARSIGDDEKARSTFLEMDRFKGAEWLLSEKSGKHGTLFKQFLAKHGHRCVRDSDIREKSWNQEPEKVIDALKVMVSSKAPPANLNAHKKVMSVDEAVNAIKTPINNIKRRVIKFVLPKARTIVGKREWAKSLGIKMMDHYRRAVYRLATILTEKGHLPDVDLIFFLLLEEIGYLVENRSPKLIAKALRRRKLFNKFNGIQFQELFPGHAEPVKAPEKVIEPGSKVFNIKGTSVGQGCHEGVARVVKSLADANQIQAGEILVVPYTDVGWTPYFPMISGLVTELGGLISHGAVVAREYGLPCLVGCKQATDLIKTGDHVSIDGHLGEIKVTVASSE